MKRRIERHRGEEAEEEKQQQRIQHKRMGSSFREWPWAFLLPCAGREIQKRVDQKATTTTATHGFRDLKTAIMALLADGRLGDRRARRRNDGTSSPSQDVPIQAKKRHVGVWPARGPVRSVRSSHTHTHTHTSWRACPASSLGLDVLFPHPPPSSLAPPPGRLKKS